MLGDFFGKTVQGPGRGEEYYIENGGVLRAEEEQEQRQEGGDAVDEVCAAQGLIGESVDHQLGLCRRGRGSACVVWLYMTSLTLLSIPHCSILYPGHNHTPSSLYRLI